jgi:hypothetical protein
MKKKFLAVLAAAAAVAPMAIVAAPASANPYLAAGTARAIAVGRVKANWNPPQWSDGYGYAWDHVKANCLRYTASKVVCSMSADMSNFSVDEYGNVWGYAWCDGLVTVSRDHWGSYHVRVSHKTSDSTSN